MYPHRIRLRGPWTCEPQFRWDESVGRSTLDLPRPFRMTMPGRWQDGGLDDFRGGVRFTRPFGYPGRIDDYERVWLTFAGVEGQARATLNGELLGAWAGDAGSVEFDVTRRLGPRNTLIVDVESPSPTGGLWGEVALEVRATAYLRDVQFRVAGEALPQVCASGLVVGSAARPLELYLFAANRFLTYDTIEPSSGGRRFELVGTLPTTPANPTIPVRIELVDAATIWYVVESSVGLAIQRPG